MEPMSKTVERVINLYGFNCEVRGRYVIVSSPNGTITFRRLNNTRYRVYGYARREVSVNRLIDIMENVL